MNKRCKKVLLYFIISISIEVFLGIASSSFLGAIFTNVKYSHEAINSLLTTIILISTGFKGFWVLVFIISEIIWKDLADRHKFLKKIYY